MYRCRISLAAVSLATLLVGTAPAAPPERTEIRKTPTGHELVRGGRPYYVNGAGASKRLTELKAAGANSIRTWGVGGDETTALLDEAHKLGLTVTLGIWLGHKDHGFDYANQKQVAEQFAAAEKAVERFKDHPAVLMWAVGNEMELGQADDPKVWREVERIAAMIRRADPAHPVISVVADMWPEKLAAVRAHCPSLHALGVNSYGGLPTLHERMKGWDRPYFVTEYAFRDPRRENKTPWGAVIEPHSTEKAKGYAANYRECVAAHTGRVLGSYAFHWDPSGSQTASFHALHLKTGEKLSAVDELTRAWSGRYPANRAPEISAVGAPAFVTAAPGVPLSVRVRATDPEGDPLAYSYEMVDEGAPRFVGDHEQPLPVVASGKLTGPEFSGKAPDKPGVYRLFLFVKDGKGGAAVANVPVRIEKPREEVQKPGG